MKIRIYVLAGLLTTLGNQVALAGERITIVVGGMDPLKTPTFGDQGKNIDLNSNPFSNNSLELATALGGSRNGYHFVPWTGNVLSKEGHESAIQATQQFIENQLKAGKTVSVLAHSDGASIAYNALQRISANHPELPPNAQVDKFVTIGTLLSDVSGERGNPSQVTTPAILQGGWLNVASQTDRLSAAIDRPGIVDVAISNPEPNSVFSFSEHSQYYQDEAVRKAIQTVLQNDGAIAEILVSRKLVSLPGEQHVLIAANNGAKKLIQEALQKDSVKSGSPTAPEGLREEARREHRENQRIEYGADRFRDLDRSAEYQLSKSAIDVHGNRVRIDSYIRRPSPTQVEHWVLNYRDHRFDYGLLRRTYDRPLASLSAIGPIDSYSFYGSPAHPGNSMVRIENIASNGSDQFYWNYLFGAPTLTNNPSGPRYYPASMDVLMRVRGTGFDAAKWQVVQTNTLNDYRTILRFPNAGSTLTTYSDQTCNRNPNACQAAIINPAAAPIVTLNQNVLRHTYKDNTWITSESWILSEDGTQLQFAPTASSTNINIEKRFRASEMGSRDIDVIYSSKFFNPDNSTPSDSSTP